MPWRSYFSSEVNSLFPQVQHLDSSMSNRPIAANSRLQTGQRSRRRSPRLVSNFESDDYIGGEIVALNDAGHSVSEDWLETYRDHLQTFLAET